MPFPGLLEWSKHAQQVCFFPGLENEAKEKKCYLGFRWLYFHQQDLFRQLESWWESLWDEAEESIQWKRLHLFVRILSVGVQL